MFPAPQQAEIKETVEAALDGFAEDRPLSFSEFAEEIEAPGAQRGPGAPAPKKRGTTLPPFVRP